MRIHRPGTDQNLDLTFTINGVTATEYELPNTPSIASSDGYLNTYIAVKLGDRLGLKWTWSGSLLHGQFDFVADGTFVRENRIEGDSQTGAIRFVKKTQKFDTGLNCPTPEGWTSVEPNKDIFEGNLVVAHLDKESLIETAGGNRPGVGSLVFVASVNQQTWDQYHDPEKSIEVGSWKTRVGDGVRLADIPPEFSLDLRLSSDDSIKPKRSVQHRNRWGQTRFGLKAWGKMCFYYRSASAIERAGGVLRDEKKNLEVEAWNDERHFVKVEPVKRPAPKKKGGAVSEDDEGDDSLFVSNKGTPDRKIKQENTSDQPDTPKPKKKKAKLGGALFGSAEKSQHKDDNVPILTVVSEENEDETFGSQYDIEPTSSELAGAPDEDPFQYNSNASAEKFDNFDRQASDASASAHVDETAPSPPKWNFPSSPPPRRRKLIEYLSPSSSVNVATTPSIDSPTQSFTLPTPLIATTAATNTNVAIDSTDTQPDSNMDQFHVPTMIEIALEIDPTGTPRHQLENLLYANGRSYADPSAAETSFRQRIDSTAVLRSDGKYYLKRNKDSVASTEGSKGAVPRRKVTAKKTSPAPRAVAKKISSVFKAPASKTTPGTKQVTAARTRSNANLVVSPALTHGDVGKDNSPGPSPRRDSPRQASALAAFKCKLAPPPAATTPASNNKRSRTESSTPGAASSLKARKHYKASLRRDLAAKEALLQKAGERVKREEEQIAELEMLNREADERLRELEDDDDEDDEADDDDEGMEYDDGEEDGMGDD